MINQTSIDTTDETAEIMGEDELADIQKKSVSGVLSFGVRTLLLQAIGLGSTILLSAFFGPEEFGIYGYVTQIIGILLFFSDVGLAAVLIQKKSEPTTEDYRAAFTVQQLLSWAIVGLVSLIIATGFVEQKVGVAGVWVLVALALSFPIATFRTISSVRLERRLDFGKLVWPQIVEQVLFHVILIGLAWRGVGVIAYAYAIIFRSLAGAVVAFAIEPWSIGISFKKENIKALVGYGFKFQLNDFLARIKDQLFFLVIGTWLPLREFGYISWAKQWSFYPYNLTVQNVMAVTFPTFARLQHNKEALRKAIEKSLFFISIGTFPLLVGMSIFIIPLVHLVDRYQKWEPAILSLIFFSLSIGWGAISTPLTNTLNAIGKINTTLKLMLFWTGITWLLTPILVWKFGYNGVALSSFIISFTSILSIYYVKKVVELDVWSQVWRPLVAVGVMAAVGVVGLPYWEQSMVWLGGGVIITGLTYVITLGLIGYQTIHQQVLELLKKRG